MFTAIDYRSILVLPCFQNKCLINYTFKPTDSDPYFNPNPFFHIILTNRVH